MARFSAFLDACVLVPLAPCDTMLRMAESGAFRPLWSLRVIEEALDALERLYPDLDPSRFKSRFWSMNEAFDDAMVRGWEALETSINLPDPDDRHVVAAAILGRADLIVTRNLKDFPKATLGPLGLEAVHPDVFLLDQYDLNPVATRLVITEQAAAMNCPPVSTHELLKRISISGAPRFAQALHESFESTEPDAPS